MILKSAQELLKTKIYPNYTEFKESATKCLRESDSEFFFRWVPNGTRIIKKKSG